MPEMPEGPAVLGAVALFALLSGALALTVGARRWAGRLILLGLFVAFVAAWV